MGRATLFDTRKKASQSSMVPRNFKSESPSTSCTALPARGAGHNFGRMRVAPVQNPVTESCPLQESPTHCPFGGACHICPAGKQSNKGSPAADGGSPAPAPACAAGADAEKMTACIQPVVIADDDGSNPTTAPSFGQVTAIWGKCCINYSINSAKTVKKTDYKTLEESPTNVPSQEEKDLFNDAGSSTCIQVFVPATFSQGGNTGKDISGGGGTYDAGTANPKIVVVEGVVSEVVAHEVGHASGYTGHDANNTVMKPTGAYNKPNSTAVSADVCSRARTGAVLKKAGTAKDCCMTLS